MSFEEDLRLRLLSYPQVQAVDGDALTYFCRAFDEARSSDVIIDVTAPQWGMSFAPGADANLNAEILQSISDHLYAELPGALVLFPGGPSTEYPMDGHVNFRSSNTMLYAPGRARLKVATEAHVLLSAGDIETGVNLAQGNTLDTNALKGARSITLSAGKGANIVAGRYYALWSEAITPDGSPSTVFNLVAEFVHVRAVVGDVLTLEAPLQYNYLTSDNAEVRAIDWIENFGIKGLGVAGNNQTPCRIAYQLSWCLGANVEEVSAFDLQQRFVRFQGCLLHRADKIRQVNGLSNGFYGDSLHFSYMLSEQALCAKGLFTNMHAERIRHGFTTGAGWTNNDGITSGVITGVGIPMSTIVSNGQAFNMRGAGWDTHEVGADITFHNLHIDGGISAGIQVRSVRQRIRNCYARNILGAALQVGGDGVDTLIEGFEWDNCNLEPDLIDPTFEWNKRCGIVDNGTGTTFGTSAPNAADNGNFDVWDRGSSYTATGATANRWRVTVGTGETIAVSRQSHALAESGPQSGRYFMRCNRTVTGVADATYVSQRLGDADVRTLANKRVMLSFDARSAGTVREGRVWIRQYFGTGGSPEPDVDTPAVTLYWDINWIRQFVVIDVPDISAKTIGSNEDSHTEIVFEWPIANGNNFFDLDRVKLEVGKYPTDFVPESRAETRERCLRWFECSNVDGQAPGSATSAGNVIASSAAAPGGHAQAWGRTVHMAARKARLPTVQTYAPTSGTAGVMRNLTTAADIAVTVTNVGQSSFYARPTTSGTVAANDVTAFSWTASCAGFE